MFNNIAFVGGIHGVGKNTICTEICDSLKLHHISASEIIKWNNISKDSRDKKVDNINDTQNKLIIGLKSIINNNQFYLLAGHYCLLDRNNNISTVPIDTFQQLNPISLNLIIGNTYEIQQRLQKRDNKFYDIKLLEEMQICEKSHAIKISESLRIPLNIGDQKDYSLIFQSLNFLINK